MALLVAEFLQRFLWSPWRNNTTKPFITAMGCYPYPRGGSACALKCQASDLRFRHRQPTVGCCHGCFHRTNVLQNAALAGGIRPPVGGEIIFTLNIYEPVHQNHIAGGRFEFGFSSGPPRRPAIFDRRSRAGGLPTLGSLSLRQRRPHARRLH